MNINDLITERASTHGPFEVQAEIAQLLKSIARSTSGWSKLSFVDKEAIEMILHKLSRILAGNPKEIDHARDLSGYALLMVRDLERLQNM